MGTVTSRHRLPLMIYTRQTFSLHGSVHARDQVPRRFFDRTSGTRNDHHRIPHHRPEQVEANPDNTNSPPRAEMRESRADRVIEEIENLFSNSTLGSGFDDPIRK